MNWDGVKSLSDVASIYHKLYDNDSLDAALRHFIKALFMRDDVLAQYGIIPPSPLLLRIF